MKSLSFLILLAFAIGSRIQAQVTEPQMILVEGGEFMMGSDKGEGDEVPVFKTSVENFYLSKYEITVKQYREFCVATGWQMPDPPKWGWHDEHPIVNVSWQDAGAYCLWLQRETGKNYRLPWEKEWEYAARGGKKSKNTQYSGSDNIDDVAWYYETTYGSSTQPVGTMKPNELGIFDMSGNAWEWCKDSYTLSYNTKSQPGEYVNVENSRVVRGGGWDSRAAYARVANRDRDAPETFSSRTGFRVAYNK